MTRLPRPGGKAARVAKRQLGWDLYQYRYPLLLCDMRQLWRKRTLRRTRGRWWAETIRCGWGVAPRSEVVRHGLPKGFGIAGTDPLSEMVWVVRREPLINWVVTAVDRDRGTITFTSTEPPSADDYVFQKHVYD